MPRGNLFQQKVATLIVTMVAPASFAQAPPAATPPGDVTGIGNFSHIVQNLDRSLGFYEALGLQPTFPPRPFDPNPAIMMMGNTVGAQSRFVALHVPGSAIGVEIIEYKDINRKPAHPRFQDPGAGNLAIRVRDLDSLLPKLKQAGGRVLTVGGEPAKVGNVRAIFMQDPDGFIVEIGQPLNPPAASQDSGNILGGTFELTVDNLEQTADFYRLLGIQTGPAAAFNPDKLMTDTAGTPGAQFRQSHAPVPGSTAVLSFIEFKDIDRKPLHTRVQDPGTTVLQLMVRDVDATVAKIKAGGGEIVSVGGQAVAVPNVGKIALARDPNNLYLELIERQARRQSN